MDDDSSLDSRRRASPLFETPGVDAMMNRIASRIFSAEPQPVHIGKFEILETIGSGGMGVVYRARDPGLSRDVALKLLHPRLTAGEREQARLMREAHALGQLSHPNVVRLFEAGWHDGRVFLAMELVRGPTLSQWQDRDRYGWRAIVGSYLQAGAGLAAAHDAGFVHRDFKPDNCLVDEHGRVRVLDFGLVRAGVEEPVTLESSVIADDRPESGPVPALALTSPEALLGTVAYMAPEQLRGGTVDAKADQFAFCVALYEALLGDPPFPADSVQRRARCFARAVPPRPPRGHRVPSSVLRALQRGLAIDPTERWPTMSALLHALERAARPRWTWWTGSVALSASLAVVAWGVWYPSLQRCHGAEQRLEGVWDEARAVAVRDAFLSTHSAIAATAWPRVERGLADIREAWLAKHAEVCEATRIRQEQTEEVMSQRMRCLDDHRRSLDATVGVLERASSEVVLKAVGMVAALPSVDRCDDLDTLRAEVAPPTDAETLARVEALRDEIARIDAALRFETIGPRRIDAVVSEAEALGYMPLVAEAVLQRGIVREQDGRFADAEADLWRASVLALEHGHGRVQLRATERLASVVGLRLERSEQGLRLAEMTVALAKHRRDDLKVAAGYNLIGLISMNLADLDRALEMNERARELLEGALGPEHVNVGTIMNNLGLTLIQQGRYADAIEALDRALEIRRSGLGEEHPDFAQSLSNLALVYRRQGRLRESEQLRRRVVGIMRNALGDDHPRVAMNLGNLGTVLVAQGRYEQAERVLRESLEIHRKTFEPGHLRIAMSLNYIAVVRHRRGDYEEARRLHGEALQMRIDALGEHHPKVALSLAGLGSLSSDMGDFEEAERLLLRALAIQQDVLGSDHVMAGSSLVDLARNARRAGELAKARDWAERALEILLAAEVSPEEVAEAQFLLARVLGPDDSERARELARRARGIYAQLEPQHADTLTSIDDWLAGLPS